MSNRMKALYAIVLPKTGDKSDAARIAQDVNEERLNDNFRTITNELMKIWEGGEQNLNLLAARVTATQVVTDARIRGIIADVETNTTAIAVMPDGIFAQVSDTLSGYALTEYVDEQDQTNAEAASSAANNAYQEATSYTDAQLSLTASALRAEFSQNDLSSWVRVYGIGNDLGIPPGVIIGDTLSSTSFKAQGDIIFFYRGGDSEATNANAVASFDGNGNFNAGSIHNTSTLLDGKFDIDVVTASSGGSNVDFLHITGRS